MTLVKWTPRPPAFNFFDDIERMVSQAFGNSMVTRENWSPAFNLIESQRGYLIEADLPGVDKKDVEVNISDGRLTVSGERKGSTCTEKSNVHLRESWEGQFQRSFVLPENADSENVKAGFKNGVLTLTIPKLEPIKPEIKQITIR